MNFRRYARTAGVAALVIAGSASTAAAQGIKFGTTFTDFRGDALDYKNRTGVFAGLFFGGNRDGVIGLQSEVNWIRKTSEPETGGPAIRIDYLQVPILLRLNIGSSSSSGPSIYGLAGPALDLKIGDDIEGVTLDNGFETVDVTLVFGGGIEVARIVIEGRYDRGLRSINDAFNNLADIKKQTFTVLVGFRFN